MDKQLSIVLSLVVVGVLGVFIFSPDIVSRLRTQVVPEVSVTVEKDFSWTPGDAEESGVRQLTIEATDDKGNITRRKIPITVAGLIDDLQITPSETGALFSWNTAVETTGGVLIDLNDKFRRLEEDTEALGTTHTFTISGLTPCTEYVYKLRAVLDRRTVDGVKSSFYTSGCVGRAGIRGTAKEDITTSGGTVTLPDKLTLSVPADAVTEENHFQINQLDRDAALDEIGTPEDLSPITGLYELSAHTDPATITDSFNNPIGIDLSYTPSDDTDLSTLVVGRYDDGSWQKLPDCTVNTSTQTISCTTTEFSVVGGFVAGASTEDEQPETPSGGGDGGGGGGGGGDSGGGSSEPTQDSSPSRTFVYQAEQQHKLEGDYAEMVSFGSIRAAKLPHPKALLSKSVTVPRGDYWLYINTRDDRPGPVDIAIYVNNTAWKVIRLNKNDNKFRTYKVGLLRNFAGATIRFRVTTDSFDRSNPSNEDADRNGFIDWWSLSTENNGPVVTTSSTATGGGSTASRGSAGRSSGWTLLPRVNTIIREELGASHVNPQTWAYYAWRLALPTSHPASVQSETHLRTIMRYWKGARPSQPYGEKL